MLEVPRRLYEEAVKRGVDIEDLLIMVLSERLQLDPKETAEARLELARKYLGETREYIARGDVPQAGEKLYKVVEECIKALAEAFNTPQLEEVRRRGKWDTWLLGMAATDLARILKDDRIRNAWSNAYDVHVWGFHEVKYGIDYVKAALPLAEWLLGFTEQVITGLRKSQ